MRIYCLALLILCLPSSAMAKSAAEQSVQIKPSDVRTGQFTTTFTALSGHATYSQIIRRILGAAAAEVAESEYRDPAQSRHSINLAAESFNLYIPKSYDASKPFGLFVFVSPFDQAGPPKEFIRGLEKHNLIFVRANSSGNRHDGLRRRIPLALHAAANAVQKYNIDPARIYIGGISGGAKVAGFLGVAYGDIFRGAVYIVGSKPIGQGDVLVPEGELGQKIMTQNRYVFITGKHDFNRKPVRKHYRSYKANGFANITLLDMFGMGHTAPTPRTFDRALQALDQR